MGHYELNGPNQMSQLRAQLFPVDLLTLNPTPFNVLGQTLKQKKSNRRRVTTTSELKTRHLDEFCGEDATKLSACSGLFISNITITPNSSQY